MFIEGHLEASRFIDLEGGRIRMTHLSNASVMLEEFECLECWLSEEFGDGGELAGGKIGIVSAIINFFDGE